jgi:hypothetical protein
MPLSNEGRPRLVARSWKTVKVTKMTALGRITRGRKAFPLLQERFHTAKTQSGREDFD